MREIYLDNNATTRPLHQVVDAMVYAAGPGFGNPSSVHSAGDRARDQLRHARECVERLIGADPGALFFTSGGTEANSLVLRSVLESPQVPKRIVTTRVEHSSVLQTCEYLETKGVAVHYLDVDGAGHLSLSEVNAAITPGTDLVSVQWVNNETGVILPIEEIGALCTQRGVPFHTDAAQAIGKIEAAVARLPIDFLSFTAHKFHGPQGVGALYVRSGRVLPPLMFGGDQEGRLRPGTENLMGIIGMGRAAELRTDRLGSVLGALAQRRDEFERTLLSLIPGAVVNGCKERRVCNTTNIRFPDIDGQALVARLDQLGIRCSQSSACTNQRPEPSYVLRAMGLTEEEAYASIRFSVSELNTREEVNATATQVAQVWAQMHAWSHDRRVGVAAG